ncbi:MAG: efflux RND transporter periplasmic adaptor subunit [Gracilibacteraceae bacterium]|nr:efflux RND transporter periplasmic adaptor subunit [Gracilibacteraceae bacterium]
MKTRPRHVMAGLAVISFLAALTLSGCSQESQEEAPNVINVETAVVQTMDITKYSSYSGQAAGSVEESVMPKMSGRVVAVEVTEGQAVREGQVIMRIDSGKVELSVRQAEAALTSAQAALAANEVRRRTALANYERLEELFREGAVSQQTLEAAQAEYDILSAGAAEAGVAQAEAALNAALQTLADCAVTSPLDGTVGRLNVTVGDTAGGGPVAVVNNTADLEVEVKVSQSDISSVQAGTGVSVLIGAIGGEPFTGTVKSVASVADPLTNAYPVKVTLPNDPDAQIKSGMFVEVLLGTRHRAGVAAIPMEAVLPQNGENIVYVVNEENRAQAVVVQTGLNDGTYIEIIDGLLEGQRIVTKGNTLIDETSVMDLADGGDAQ